MRPGARWGWDLRREEVGAKIGRYKILEKIERVEFGVVLNGRARSQ